MYVPSQVTQPRQASVYSSVIGVVDPFRALSGAEGKELNTLTNTPMWASVVLKEEQHWVMKIR